MKKNNKTVHNVYQEYLKEQHDKKNEKDNLIVSELYEYGKINNLYRNLKK